MKQKEFKVFHSYTHNGIAYHNTIIFNSLRKAKKYVKYTKKHDKTSGVCLAY